MLMTMMIEFLVTDDLMYLLGVSLHQTRRTIGRPTNDWEVMGTAIFDLACLERNNVHSRMSKVRLSTGTNSQVRHKARSAGIAGHSREETGSSIRGSSRSRQEYGLSVTTCCSQIVGAVRTREAKVVPCRALCSCPQESTSAGKAKSTHASERNESIHERKRRRIKTLNLVEVSDHASRGSILDVEMRTMMGTLSGPERARSAWWVGEVLIWTC